MGTDLICGRHQLSHHMHHIFFPMSQNVDTTSNPEIGESVNAPALLLAKWKRTVQGQESISSPALGHMHIIAAVDQSLRELTSY